MKNKYLHLIFTRSSGKKMKYNIKIVKLFETESIKGINSYTFIFYVPFSFCIQYYASSSDL